MAFQPGDRIGPYEILSTLGAGGMGVVYRARDSRLGRDVAIKTLPDDVAADPERFTRFEREARSLAALNHVNIASIHGFETAGSSHLLVMELVEGETLADWIARGPIPVERALPLFLQIAAGLEAAHAKGIVHRDLKPANIKIANGAPAGGSARELRAGAVKILDFGLAKALASGDGAPPGGSLSHSPTLTMQATMRGELLGTAAYMAPEQAEGEPADERADIWAFGVCLYEALTGRRPFDGAKLSHVLASVLKDEPDWAALPAATPPPVRRLLRRCLEKNRDRRLHDIADARLEIEEALAAPAAEPDRVASAPRRASRLSKAVTAGAGLALGVAGTLLVVGWLRPAPAPAPVARFVLEAPNQEAGAASRLSSVAIAGDGSVVVYDKGEITSATLLVRRLDQLEGAPVRGVEPGAVLPFLSPDDRWVGYVDSVGRTLRKISILGGPSVTLCEISPQAVGGASWGPDDTIVFGQINGPLRRASAAGGGAQDLTQLAEGEVAHLFPEFLPGGEALLFAAMESFDSRGAVAIHALSLATGERKVVLAGGTQPRYAASGHLIYPVGTTLYAVAFDPRRLEVTGDPVPVVERVGVYSTPGAAISRYAVSASGALVYVVGGGEQPQHGLIWIDREGREEPIGAPPRYYVYPRLSPDGTRVALDVREGEEDIWIWDLERETTLRRLTFSPGTDAAPVWSPDGRTVFFASALEGGDWDLVGRLADGTGEQRRLTRRRSSLMPTSVTPDGAELLVATSTTAFLAEDILGVDTAGKAEPRTLLDADSRFANATVSPDGRWLAYEMYESGSSRIFVRPFPALDSGGPWQVSTDGATRPLWSRDGEELFYLDASSFLTAVAVEGRDGALTLGRPETVIRKAFVNAKSGRTYDVSPDGRRFLMIKGVSQEQDENVGRIVLVQNWFDELRRLAPARGR